MTDFLWDLHVHTAETSACGKSSGAAMARAYADLGFQGIVVTDHFVNANCVMPKGDPWQSRIDGLLKGFQVTKAAGDELGLAVLLGWEFYHQGADFITFGLPEAFLRDQPDLCDISMETYAARVKAAGGFLAQAHPYRSAWYIQEDIQQRWDIVEGLEVINGSHKPDERHWDQKALALAKAHGLIETAGSDAHSVAAAGTAAIAFPKSFETVNDLMQALRQRQGRPIRRIR